MQFAFADCSASDPADADYSPNCNTYTVRLEPTSGVVFEQGGSATIDFDLYVSRNNSSSNIPTTAVVKVYFGKAGAEQTELFSAITNLAVASPPPSSFSKSIANLDSGAYVFTAVLYDSTGTAKAEDGYQADNTSTAVVRIERESVQLPETNPLLVLIVLVAVLGLIKRK